jgi:hypothetical protein
MTGLPVGLRAMLRAAGTFWVIAACTPVPASDPVPAAPDTAPSAAEEPEDLVPAGFGSLRQDDFSVLLADATLQVKVTPLTEEVIRLAAPDTYERLHALAWSRLDAAQAALDSDEHPELFLVSFFSRTPNVEYHPEELQLTHRGRMVRPAGILPLTAGWGRHLLQPQQTQSAIYVFEPPFDYALPIMVRYGVQQSDEWHRAVVPRLDDERTRVRSRAQGHGRAGRDD